MKRVKKEKTSYGLQASCQLEKVSEERIAYFQEIMRKLFEELSQDKVKSSEVEKLLEENKEEKARLITHCDELKSEACLQAERPLEVPFEFLKKMKEDYLASEEFWDEKIECAMDGFLQGFDKCIHQLKELEPNFDVVA